MPASQEEASHEASSEPRDEAERRRIARLEIDNGFRQYDLAIEIIKAYLDPDRPFALRPSLIRQLQAVAVDGIEPYPGEWRTGKAKISQSRHVPAEPHMIGFLVQEMCDYVNDNLHEKTAFHLAAYIMWRLNWIHSFSDGNGRTSRITSYIVLCVCLKTILPGSPTIPQQIQDDRTTYFRALEAADEAARNDRLDLSAMESAIKGMLARQLLSVIDQAEGVSEADRSS